MTVFTGWAGAAFAILIWLLASVALAAAWHLTKRAWQRHQVRAGIRLADKYPVRDRFAAIHERIHNPERTCPYHDTGNGVSLGYECGCVYWMPVYQPCPAHEAMHEIERGMAQ